MIHPLPRRFHFVVLLVAAAAAIASTWPVALHWRDHVVDGARLINPKDAGNFWAANIGADVLTTVWVVNWVLHALGTQPLHLFEANIFYPAPHALARSEHIVATALLGAPGRLLAGPVAAHQSALLLCIALNVWATAYLVTRWTGSLLGGLVAGLLFAVSPFHQGGLFHLQRLGTFYYPLILLGLERFGATGGVAWVALAAAAFVMQLLSGQYLAYFALGVWGIGGTLALAARWSTARPLRRVGRDAAWLGGATAAAALAVLPFAVPYALLEAGGELPDNTTHLVMSSLPALRCYLFGSYLIPNVQVPPAAWLLAIPGMIVLALGGRTERTRLAMVLGIGLFGALLSLGPKPGGLGIYRLCVAIVPGFRTAREPHRAAVLVYLAVAILAGCGAAVLMRRPRLGAPVTVAALALALAASWRAPTLLRRMPVGASLPPAYAFLARCGAGDPLLELPAHLLADNWRDAERMFFSTYHWLPLLNGRSGYSPPLMARTMPLANRLPDPDALAQLRQLTAVRWVLVHCDHPATPKLPVAGLCAGATWPDTHLHDFGVMRLYDLGRAPALPRPWPRRGEPAEGCDS